MDKQAYAGLLERLVEETVIQQGEPVTVMFPDGSFTEVPGAVTTMRRNPDGPEAAEAISSLLKALRASHDIVQMYGSAETFALVTAALNSDAPLSIGEGDRG